MDNDKRLTYGLSRDLFVAPKSQGETIVVGGVSGDTSRWVRILSKRAAQLLLFQLTQILDPDKARHMNAGVTTAPMRDLNRPTITTHMAVDERPEGGYRIIGWPVTRCGIHTSHGWKHSACGWRSPVPSTRINRINNTLPAKSLASLCRLPYWWSLFAFCLKPIFVLQLGQFDTDGCPLQEKAT
ncbi:hypothetical protein HC928_13690 [bacterium]|nr:hypothetical protein [bacterium]